MNNKKVTEKYFRRFYNRVQHTAERKQRKGGINVKQILYIECIVTGSNLTSMLLLKIIAIVRLILRVKITFR